MYWRKSFSEYHLVDPIVDFGYEGMCNTPSVNFACKTLVKLLYYEVLHLEKGI